MGENIHIAIYGNQKMKRGYCPRCKKSALIIGGLLQCCETQVGGLSSVHRVKLMSQPAQRRKLPSLEERREIVEAQGNKCFYCEREFGTPFLKGHKHTLQFLNVTWDHLAPYSFAQNNQKQNFVAACQICNGIKGSMVFETISDARRYVQKKMERRQMVFEHPET